MILNFLNRIGDIAASPYAFLAYISVIAAWVYTTVAQYKLNKIADIIKDIPEEKRAEVIARDYGPIPQDMSAEIWIKSKKHTLLFLSFLATLVVISVFIILVLTSKSDNVNGRINQTEEYIIKTKEDIAHINEDFENAAQRRDNGNKDSFNILSKKVRDNAPTAGQQMLDIDDTNASIWHKILKYEYASFAFFMAASYPNSDENRIIYSNKSIDSAKHAINLIHEVFQHASNGDSYYSNLKEKITSRNFDKERVMFIMIASSVISNRNNKNISIVGDICKYLEDVRDLNHGFFEEHPLESNPYINAFFKEHNIRNNKCDI